MDSIGLLATLGNAAVIGTRLTSIISFNSSNSEKSYTIGTFKYAIVCLTCGYNRDSNPNTITPVSNSIIIGPNMGNNVAIYAYSSPNTSPFSSEVARIISTINTITISTSSNCRIAGTITAFN